MFNLTRHEKLVIIFIMAAVIVGSAALYYKDRSIPRDTAIETPQARPALVNINNADEKQLASLPHIGPTIAKRIIQYRQENGPFLLKEDLKKVKGISAKAFADIETLITTQ